MIKVIQCNTTCEQKSNYINLQALCLQTKYKKRSSVTQLSKQPIAYNNVRTTNYKAGKCVLKKLNNSELHNLKPNFPVPSILN